MSNTPTFGDLLEQMRAMPDAKLDTIAAKRMRGPRGEHLARRGSVEYLTILAARAVQAERKGINRPSNGVSGLEPPG